MWRIVWTPEAAQELLNLRAFDRRILLASAREHLTVEPDVASRHRKQIRGLVPPWGSAEPFWELRVRLYRVCYDVVKRDHEVHVRAVRLKPLGARTEDIL